MKLSLITTWLIFGEFAGNPDSKRVTWRQKTPLIQRRLDFWLISNLLQDETSKTDIIPAIKSDHSALSLTIKSIREYKNGPSYWKFNSSLTEDKEYVNLIKHSYLEWLIEFNDVEDKRVMWDIVKYKIRQETIKYGKSKARIRRNYLQEIGS